PHDGGDGGGLAEAGTDGKDGGGVEQGRGGCGGSGQDLGHEFRERSGNDGLHGLGNGGGNEAGAHAQGGSRGQNRGAGFSARTGEDEDVAVATLVGVGGAGRQEGGDVAGAGDAQMGGGAKDDRVARVDWTFAVGTEAAGEIGGEDGAGEMLVQVEDDFADGTAEGTEKASAENGVHEEVAGEDVGAQRLPSGGVEAGGFDDEGGDASRFKLFREDLAVAAVVARTAQNGDAARERAREIAHDGGFQRRGGMIHERCGRNARGHGGAVKLARLDCGEEPQTT